MTETLADWLRGFLPAPMLVDRFERMRACAGALLGIGLTGGLSYAVLGATPGALWLMAPMGASAVLAFAVPASPLAQPWSVVGGNLVAAVVGVTCAKLFLAPLVAASLAIAIAIGFMFAFRCVHPPSGAVALTAVVGGPAIQALGYGFVLAPVLLNSLLLVSAALLYNNATGRCYPHRQAAPAPNPAPSNNQGHGESGKTYPPRPASASLLVSDVEEVLKRNNQTLDISRDDLRNLFLQTEMLAYARRFGETDCASIMQTPVQHVQFGADLAEAWQQMRQHKLKALPVVDRGQRVVGIVTAADFVRHADAQLAGSLANRLRHVLEKTGLSHSSKPEVVGQIMSTPAITATATQAILTLVPLMSERGLRHIPIVDEDRKLVGMVSQAQVIAALYGQQMLRGDAP